jgi:hypothetical protein
MTSDGSLRGESGEYVSRGGLKLDDAERAIIELRQLFQNSTLNPSARCGVHVHISIQDMLVEHFTNLCILYYILEPIILYKCGPDRQGNLFCLSAAMTEWPLEWLTRARQEGTIQPIPSDSVKYAALNLGAIFRYGSLELRSIPTPVDVKDILPWVQLLARLKDYSITHNDASSYIRGVSLQTPIGWLGHVLGDEVSAWLIKGMSPAQVESLLYEGVRIVQTVAMTKWNEDADDPSTAGRKLSRREQMKDTIWPYKVPKDPKEVRAKKKTKPKSTPGGLTLNEAGRMVFENRLRREQQAQPLPPVRWRTATNGPDNNTTWDANDLGSGIQRRNLIDDEGDDF